MKKNSLVSKIMESNESIELLTPHYAIGSCSIDYKPFDDVIMEFINDFSRAMLLNVHFKQYPELIALAFWMRKGNIKKLRAECLERNHDRIITCRGEALHFAPSNVDSIFIYSLFLSLLVGNKNTVRVSSKKSVQQSLIIDLISNLLQQEKYLGLQQYIVIINYYHDENITRSLSNQSDVRVIWGGDATINTISKISLPTKAIDIKFANKYSYSVLGANKVSELDSDELASLAASFVNDSYLFGQMGCSSPKNIYWLGKTQQIKVAKNKFWSAVEIQLQKFDHQLSDADFINKFVVECDSALTKHISIPQIQSMLLSRIVNQSSQLFDDNNEHCGSGLFFEDSIESLNELGEVINRNTQTITYAGIDKNEFAKAMDQWSVLPDRIVPCGNALTFGRVWDGYDLIETFARFVTIE